MTCRDALGANLPEGFPHRSRRMVGDDRPRLGVLHPLARLGALYDFGTRGLRGRRCGEQVEAADWDVIFRNLRNLACELVDPDEAFGRIGTPSELALEPRQPIAVTTALLALGEQSPDLDDVTDDPLAEDADS